MKDDRTPEVFIPANKLLEQFYYAAKLLDFAGLLFDSYNVHYVERAFHPDVVGITYLKYDSFAVYPHGEAVRVYDRADFRTQAGRQRYIGTFTTLFPPFWYYVGTYADTRGSIVMEHVVGAVEAAQHYVERIYEKQEKGKEGTSPLPG